MISSIANIKFRENNISRFEYLHIDNLKIKDKCIVETYDGIELGHVVSFQEIDLNSINNENSCCGNVCNDDTEENNFETLESSNKKNKIYKVLRIATEEDIKKYEDNKISSEEAFKICKEKVKKFNLDLKLVSAYYFLDRAKLLFEFIAEERIDFRELVKDLAAQFKTRIELRQIGVRDEARAVGGCGICGRELCCRVKRNNFETISIKMAKEQSILLNTMKISGQCGRLMCCLAHEYKAYCCLKKELPKVGTKLIFNNMPAVIKDLNPLSKKLLIETEDKRSLYIDVSDLKEENEILVANIEVNNKVNGVL